MIFAYRKVPLKENRKENLNWFFYEWRSWKGIQKLEELGGVREILEAFASVHKYLVIP